MSARKASASARVMSSCATSEIQESRKAAPKMPLPDQRAISSGVVASCPKCTTNQASGNASAAPIQTRLRIIPPGGLRDQIGAGSEIRPPAVQALHQHHVRRLRAPPIDHEVEAPARGQLAGLALPGSG